MTEEDSAQAPEPVFGAWRLVMPEAWQLVPSVGVHTQLSGGAALSVVFGEETLAEGQTLASYVSNEQLLVNAVIDAPEANVIEPMNLAEVLSVVRRMSARDGTQLQSVQLYSRVGQLVALVTCVVANAELDTVRQHFDAVLRLATICCCNATDQESIPCPSLSFP